MSGADASLIVDLLMAGKVEQAQEVVDMSAHNAYCCPAAPDHEHAPDGVPRVVQGTDLCTHCGKPIERTVAGWRLDEDINERETAF